jgi:hypothetical protein
VLAGNRDLAINASIPDGIVPNSEYYAYHSPATTPEGFTSFPYFEPGPSVGGTAILTYDHQFEVGLSAGISLILPKSVPLLGGALADYTTYDADHPHAAGALGALTDLIVGNPSIMGNSVWNQQSDAGMYIGGRLWGRFAGFLHAQHELNLPRASIAEFGRHINQSIRAIHKHISRCPPPSRCLVGLRRRVPPSRSVSALYPTFTCLEGSTSPPSAPQSLMQTLCPECHLS